MCIFRVIIGEKINRIFRLSGIYYENEVMLFLLGFYAFDLTEAEIRSANIIKIQ
jgi:hypothetical protein